MRQRFHAHPDWQAAWQICQTILHAPALQHFFNPEHYRRAHNELSYIRQDGRIGRIDRVVEFEQEVWILDYKTGNIEAFFASYREQLLDYQDALQRCYPDKITRCALITQQGELIEVQQVQRV